MYYVGIDHHKKSNAITVMDQDSILVKRITLSNDKNTLD